MSEQPNSAQGVDPIRPPGSAPQPTWGDSMNQLDTYAERLRVMLPAAPPGLLDGYMRWAPWVFIVFGVIALLFMLLFSIVGSVLGSVAIVLGIVPLSFAPSAFLGAVAGLVGAALDVAGGYLMLKRRETGWWLIAVGVALAILSNLLRVSLLSLLISLAIGYVHLQVKPNYH
jgi:hypothetical protein